MDSARRPDAEAASDSGGSPAATLAASLGLICLFCLPLLSGGYSGAGYQVGFVLLPIAAGIAWAAASRRPLAATIALLLLCGGYLWSLGWLSEGRTLYYTLLHIPAAWLCVWTLLNDVPLRRGLLLPVLVLSASLSALYGLYQKLFVYTGDPHLLGTFGLHNAYAGFLLLAWPVALIALLQSSGRARLLYSASALLLCGCLVLTHSRAALLIFGLQLCALLAYALFAAARQKGESAATLLRNSALGIAGLCLASLLLPDVRSTLSALFDFGGYSMQGRLRFWQAAVEIFGDHPLGPGLGSFGYIYPQYQKDWTYYSVDPHSWPLQLMAELGIPGLLIALALIAGSVMWALRLWRGSKASPVALLLCSAVFGSLLHAAVDFDYTFGATTALLGALLALGSYTALAGSGTGAEPQSGSRDRILAVALALALCVIGALGQFYALERYMLDELRAAQSAALAARGSLLKRAISFNPRNHRTHYQLASLLAQPGSTASQREEAEAELELALRLNPRYSAAWALKGLIARPPAEGAEALRRALELDPYNFPEHYFYYASIAETPAERRERLLEGLERVPAEHPIKPDHVRAPDWHKLNPMWAQWWYELAKLAEDEEEARVYRRRGAAFQTYWESVQEERELRREEALPDEELPGMNQTQEPATSSGQ